MNNLNKRTTITVIILGFLTLAIMVTLSLVKQRQEIRQRAAEGATLQVVPQAAEVNAGNNITFDVRINSDSDLISAADITINYDPTYLEGVGVTPGTFLPVVLSTGVFTGNQGKITLGSSPADPKAGEGIVVSFTFKALAPITSTTVSLDSATAVTAVGKTGNVITSLTDGAITIVQTPAEVPADTILSFTQPTFNANSDEEFTVTLKMNTGVNQVTAADLKIHYDTTALGGISITNAGYLPVTLAG